MINGCQQQAIRVIAGLDPAIHRIKLFSMDARVKPAHDHR
jgi:hypothetical protein